jgi:DNA polymerase-3 subunit beta
MEVALEREAFLRGVQMVQNIVEPRQTLPVLSNIMLEGAGESVSVTATDLEVGARVIVPARVASPGAVTVSARKFGEIMKELSAASLTLKVGDNAAISIRCGGVSYRLVGLPPDDFPPVVPASTTAWIPVEARALREMLQQTSFAISHDENRYALNGVLFSIQGQEVRLVATDGHRLAISVRTLGSAVPTPLTGIVPRKAVTELMRVLGSSEDVQIALTENQFVLQMGATFVLTARLIEGQFPNYEAVTPKGHPGRLLVSRASLQGALRRVAVIAEERNKPVKMTVTPASLTLSASSQELGEAEETIDVDYSGQEVVMGFNSRYLLDALGAVEKDPVAFEFKDGLSPGMVKSVEDEGYCCVIMPMRI